MKKLFVFVLLCNLALAGTLILLSGEQARDGAAPPPPLPASAAPLKLLSEVPEAVEPVAQAQVASAPPTTAIAAPAVQTPTAVAPASARTQTEVPAVEPPAATPTAVAAPETPAVPPQPDLCRSFGPFESQDGADQAGRELATAGYDVTPRTANQPQLFGYWVYLPPFPSRAAAAEAAKHLADLGIRDYFIVLASGKRNAVSLGVFSKKRSAEQRKERMEALGFSPVIDERLRDHTVYWLDYRGRKEIPESVWKPLAGKNAGIKRVARDCP